MASSAKVKVVNTWVDELPEEEKQFVSDGHHTFQELYECRVALNAMAFNALPAKYSPYKSWNHSNGEPCFEGKRWFIVGAQLPTGPISFHYPEKDWKQFDIPAVDKAPVWDGHTTGNVISRIRNVNATSSHS